MEAASGLCPSCTETVVPGSEIGCPRCTEGYCSRNCLQLDAGSHHERCTGKTIYPVLSTQNFDSVLLDRKAWVFDDASAYRVTIHKTFEGNLSTKPTNGAVFLFSPCQGILYMDILHASVWNGGRKRGGFAKVLTTKHLGTLLTTITPEERPVHLVSSRRVLIPYIEAVMPSDRVPFLNLYCSDVQIPFYGLLRIDSIKDRCLKAPTFETVLYNLYDDWLDNCSGYTCLIRLVLLLRSYAINTEKTTLILEIGVERKKTEYFWPGFTCEQWVSVEKDLTRFVLQDFSDKHGIGAPEFFTPLQIQAIILGYSEINWREDDDV